MKFNGFLLLLLLSAMSLAGIAQRPYGGRSAGGQLTGTYSLDRSRSEDATRAIDRALRGVDPADAERVRNALMRRLDAPDQLAIDQAGRRITIVSNNAPQVTFQADGRAATETRPNGRTVRTAATLSRNALTISSLGDRGSDFQVTMEPIDNGRALRMRRSFYSDRIQQPVVAESFYTRTSDVAQLDLYNGDRRNPGGPGPGPGPNDRRGRDFVITDGTRITATLNNDLTTKEARPGDRFTLTVRSPRQYEGAVIEGFLVDADRSGRVTGRAELNMDFDSIRIRDGRKHDFAGYIEQVRTADGKDVKIDNEGAVKDRGSQTERTVVRSGIGAALGAIIGGIAGGGSGAAIGAAVGAGAGAGSVILQGRDDLTLRQGSEFVLRASSPRSFTSSR